MIHSFDTGSSEGAIMAITGAHVLLYTSEPEALRAVFRDVFGWKHVDAGEGWLIFALPPAELGVHPAEGPTFASGMRHQLSLMCDDINATARDLRSKGVEVNGDPEDEGWGITVMLGLPGGVQVMLYEPRHPVAAEIPREISRT
jgi:predicted enzyme related to lactoylglutathione lyase